MAASFIFLYCCDSNRTGGFPLPLQAYWAFHLAWLWDIQITILQLLEEFWFLAFDFVFEITIWRKVNVEDAYKSQKKATKPQNQKYELANR
jgi:hypothetical protein